MNWLDRYPWLIHALIGVFLVLVLAVFFVSRRERRRTYLRLRRDAEAQARAMDSLFDAVSDLGARLSDEWNMPVWVVNTAVCARTMQGFDPTLSGSTAYTGEVTLSSAADQGTAGCTNSRQDTRWLNDYSDVVLNIFGIANTKEAAKG